MGGLDLRPCRCKGGGADLFHVINSSSEGGGVGLDHLDHSREEGGDLKQQQRIIINIYIYLGREKGERGKKRPLAPTTPTSPSEKRKERGFRIINGTSLLRQKKKGKGKGGCRFRSSVSSPPLLTNEERREGGKTDLLSAGMRARMKKKKTAEKLLCTGGEERNYSAPAARPRVGKEGGGKKGKKADSPVIARLTQMIKEKKEGVSGGTATPAPSFFDARSEGREKKREKGPLYPVRHGKIQGGERGQSFPPLPAQVKQKEEGKRGKKEREAARVPARGRYSHPIQPS